MSKKYTYKGAVYAFNNLVSTHWEASTWAISEKKAISNLKYRFRKYAGLNQVPIRFSGTLTVS